MATPSGKARILLVDDEYVVAKTLAIIFSNEGYETRAVQSAEAALALLETEEWGPQLAIIDVLLPGMNGIDLAITLKAEYPEVQVSLFSGQSIIPHRRCGRVLLLSVIPRRRRGSGICSACIFRMGEASGVFAVRIGSTLLRLLFRVLPR